MLIKTFENDGDKQVVRVTFSMPSDIWADKIHLVGDFNDWDHTAHPFQRSRDGSWTITLCLDVGKVYQFRYLCDGRDWVNDCAPDGLDQPVRHWSHSGLDKRPMHKSCNYTGASNALHFERADLQHSRKLLYP